LTSPLHRPPISAHTVRAGEPSSATSRNRNPLHHPDPSHLAGLAWHHALHAWISIQRRRWWQAEYWISALRSHVIALASLRLGHPTSYAKGAHLLPTDLTTPLEATLVRTLDKTELHRALTAATHALTAELTRTDQVLADRPSPVFTELTGTQPQPHQRVVGQRPLPR
jgi:hypothetical protein